MAFGDFFPIFSEIAKNGRLTNKYLCCIKDTENANNGLNDIILLDYQPLDCEDNPVGDPLGVLPVLQVGKQNVDICNFQELADAINNNAVPYNENYQFLIDVNTNWVLSTNVALNLVHSVSISTLVGTVTVTIDGNAIDYPAGFTANFTASTTLTNDIEIDTDATGKAIVTIIAAT